MTQEKPLKWVEFGRLHYAWRNGEIGYQISIHENGSGYQLRIYKIEPAVPMLFYKSGIESLQAAKDIAEGWNLTG